MRGGGWARRAGESAAPSGMELVTGDTNILNAALVLQYVVRDPAEFLFQIEEAPPYVEAVAEAVLTETVIGMPIDEVLTRGRVGVQERVKAATQELLDRRRSGIRIGSASIMTMTLDRSVVQAFQDVANAWTTDLDRKSTRLNSSHQIISYAVFCLKKKKK